jgi:photosynthetic reaction center cytochrome c subunit
MKMNVHMNRESRRVVLGALGVVLACLVAVTTASSQAGQVEKPQMADDIFKNIQVLRGLTVDQFMGTMGFISASLSMNCSECHDLSEGGSYATDNPRKQMARRMIVMVKAFNDTNFGGKREVTCYSCHRGASRPRITPSLLEQYSTPPEDDPNDVELSRTPLPAKPSPDQVFDRYLQALGGAEKVAAVKSFVARGTYDGFDTEGYAAPVDIYAKFPDQRTTVVHLDAGDNIRTCDGTNAWNTSAGTAMPIPVVTLSGGDLLGAKLDAALSFPGQIKQLFNDWSTNFPLTVIDDNLVDVVQGTQPDHTPVKFYFDKKTGLLTRQVRFADTPIGFIPTQIDYSDYRTVAGIKMPFKLVMTWTDGRSTIQLNEIQANAPVQEARFAKPNPPAR